MSEEKSCGDVVLSNKKLSASDLCEKIIELSRRLGINAKETVKKSDPKTWLIVELCVLEGMVTPTKLAVHKLRDMLKVVEDEVDRIGKGGVNGVKEVPGVK